MSNCTNNNCDNLPCGCSTTDYTTTCEHSNCHTPGERCEELYCNQCISHCYDKFDYDVNGELLVVDNGERLLATLQRLIIASDGGTCYRTAVVGLRSTGVTNASIGLAWAAPLVASTYTVKYRVAGAGTWITAATALAAAAYELNCGAGQCLASATTYEIIVEGSNAACPSVRIYTTTL